jgi:tRNA pseudouridine38-40 synthase
MLPPEIAVVEVTEVGDDFHPRFSATGKHYRYLVLTRAERSPRWRDRAWHHPEPLDVAAMREAAAALIGEHDFAAFRAAGCNAKTTIRRLDDIAISEFPGEPLLAFEIRGNAFLRNMVRILVGTLVEVGEGRRPAAQMAEILANKDRTKAGITAPARGLELVSVRYDGTRGEANRKIAPAGGVG